MRRTRVCQAKSLWFKTMELILSEEQMLLKDSAARFMEQSAGASLVRRVRDEDAPFDRGIWLEMAQAGWLSILVSEDAGGLGLGMTELALVLEEAGKALLPGPIAAAAASARIIAGAPDFSGRQDLIGGILGGDLVVVPALQEAAFGIDPAKTECRAAADGDGWRISGEKAFIPDAGGADGFLVNASGPDGLILSYLPVDADGAVLGLNPSVDGGDTGTLSLDGAPAQMIAGPNHARDACRGLLDLTLLGLGAGLLGIMETALDMSVEYLKIRTQFDQPIGAFQALQHRAANDYVDTELTRSFLYQVCAAAGRGEDISAMASAVKAKASGAALTITKSAIQFHGAIGVSDEHDIGLYLKRAIAMSSHYGNEMAHRARFAELSGAGANQK
jgi:alkylation response protein AidB-like acyl-CoA dehydrogenase